jgi:hypothetical protein
LGLGKGGVAVYIKETAFIIRETIFIIRETAFIRRETSFTIKETSLTIRETAFIKRETIFIIRNTTFTIRETSLSIKETAFIIRETYTTTNLFVPDSDFEPRNLSLRKRLLFYINGVPKPVTSRARHFRRQKPLFLQGFEDYTKTYIIFSGIPARHSYPSLA